MPEIIRLVQQVVSDVLTSLDIEDCAGAMAAFDVEHGIVAELVKERVNGSNI